MGYRPIKRGGGGYHRDENEPAIVAALEARGYDVTRVNGEGVPDLLVRHPGASWAKGLEVKNPSGRRRLTKAQQVSKWPVVLTPDEAIAEVVKGAEPGV